MVHVTSKFDIREFDMYLLAFLSGPCLIYRHVYLASMTRIYSGLQSSWGNSCVPIPPNTQTFWIVVDLWTCVPPLSMVPINFVTLTFGSFGARPLLFSRSRTSSKHLTLTLPKSDLTAERDPHWIPRSMTLINS
jgi:hypothetical protein